MNIDKSEIAAMKQHQITRDGKPPLRFTGERIGQGVTPHDHNGNRNRWTEISIYITKAGRVVVREEYRTQWQGESDTSLARSFETAVDAVGYLRDSAESCGYEAGKLTEEAAEAVEEAAENNAEFAAAWVENVD